MSISKDKVRDALRKVTGPDGAGNVVDLGLLSEIIIRDGRVYFSITVPSNRAQQLEPLRQSAEKAVSSVEGVTAVTAVLTGEAPKGGAANGSGKTARPAPQAQPSGATGVPGVKHLIAVASGKGGVGKSTTAVNLALALKSMGLKVGIFDADIYGPSQPRLLGLSGEPPNTDHGKSKIIPHSAYGVKVMSMGFLVDEGTPVVWRGPMVVQALRQMLFDVAWDEDGPLDALIIDMPPGTGDVQLTLAQQAPLSGAVIISTPQDLALIDARKGLTMFQRVNVPVLGLIENMSYFLCPKCGDRSDIFGHGGAEIEAAKLSLPFLGGIPLHMDIRELSDAGRPVVATRPESAEAKIYQEIAVKVWDEVQSAKGADVPALKISDAGDSLNVSYGGKQSYDLPAEMLRVMSPSAEVQGHSAEQRITVAGKRNVKINGITPVGKYAAKIIFDDGHDTGLFTWTYLQHLGEDKDIRWADYLAELEAKGLTRG